MVLMMDIVGALTGSQNLRVKFVIPRIVCVLGQGHRNFLRDVTSSSCNDTLFICAFSVVILQYGIFTHLL